MIYNAADLTLDINTQTKDVINTAIQFSTQDVGTARLIFTVTKNDNALSLSSAVAKLTMIAEDGSRFDRVVDIVDVQQGVAQYTLSDEEIKHHGTVIAELRLIYDGNRSVSVHKFSFLIDQSLVDTDIVPTAEYYIDDFESLKSEISTKADAMNDRITAVEDDLIGIENVETQAGAQAKVDAHSADTDLHISSEERAKWNDMVSLSKDIEKDVAKLSAENAESRLVLLSAYDDIDAYHPKVISFDTRWNGYLYWMAFTPYPGGDQSKENPHILVSNDMINWSLPSGFKNPLEPQPNGEPSSQYNSDTHIVYNGQLDRVEVYWRFVDDVSGTVTIYRKTTYDGVTWSDKEVAITGDRSVRDYISPAIIFEDGKYKMWCVSNGYKVIYSESTNGTSWGEFREIVIPFESPMNLWHLDVIHTDVGYEMIVTAFADGQDRNTMTLFHSVSKDNETFSTAKPILEPSKREFAWDNRGIYRACLMKKDGIYYLYYCATSKNWQRGIGLSFGTDLDHLKGLDQRDIYIMQNVKAVNMVYDAFLRNYGLQLSALQSDGSVWKACLRFSNSGEVKFVNDFTEGTLINLAAEAIRTVSGLKFIGKSAYYDSNEFKVYEPGRASIVGVGDADFLRPKRVSDTSQAGGLELSAVKFEDNGKWSGIEREGVIRYDSSRKKHVAYDGSTWHDLY
ncbi:BppU family phage baseplate upper protein [Bacillus paralicheniformis]|uniref:BppU family phage baseplate upper protein n=1 Tax=Bacillus paralicheniformis TaxID=1648923 RepID=UPI0014954E4F|nr:BppU family phage baseplate upper protein [Bacillus paralicheniformis]MED4309155.1 BppU family phage baseplate upper protein [Bacillus paralicheniformis]MED4346957.1 BppU family phage baseplate upper protein [Bacillus paralicheniformis]